MFVVTAQSIHGKVYLRQQGKRWTSEKDFAYFYRSERGAEKALKRAQRKFAGLLDRFCVEVSS